MTRVGVSVNYFGFAISWKDVVELREGIKIDTSLFNYPFSAVTVNVFSCPSVL